MFSGKISQFPSLNQMRPPYEAGLLSIQELTLIQIKIMNEIPKCPKCGSEYTYFDGSLYVCPDCSHEFDSVDEAVEADDVARDSNGAELFDGDAVTVIKDLKVKGSSMVIKRGTKVRSIRLTENPEEVDCKIEGSSIVLKTCFLKK